MPLEKITWQGKSTYPGKPYVHEPLANTCLKPSLILLLQGNPLKSWIPIWELVKRSTQSLLTDQNNICPTPLCSLKDLNNFKVDYKAMSRFLYNLTASINHSSYKLEQKTNYTEPNHTVSDTAIRMSSWRISPLLTGRLTRYMYRAGAKNLWRGNYRINSVVEKIAIKPQRSLCKVAKSCLKSPTFILHKKIVGVSDSNLWRPS